MPAQGLTNSPLVEASSSTVSTCCSDYHIIGGLAVTGVARYLRLTCFLSPSSQSGDSGLLLLVLHEGEMSSSVLYALKLAPN